MTAIHLAQNVGAIHCAILGATSLPTISHQPLIYSYGWIRTIDTIILPARLIFKSEKDFSYALRLGAPCATCRPGYPDAEDK